jgi:hypothetical protein
MKPLPIVFAVCSLGWLYFFGVHLRDFESISLGDSPGWSLTKIQLQVGISVPIAIGALFVTVARRYCPKDRYWAYAMIGALIGFWLHPQRP